MGGLLARSTGYDHLALYRRECGAERLPCGYLPLYCQRSVAEQAMLLWMSLLRRLPLQRRNFDCFERDGLTGRECRGATLLVVGVGNIGTEVVGIGEALGMTVLGVDIDEKHDSVSYVPVREGLARADVIVCCMNLTEQNRGYFSYDLLRKARPGAVFVNIARGELAPTRGLAQLLDEGRLGGVALDVYEEESRLAVSLRSGRPCEGETIRATLELAKRPNVVLTPHNAFNTEEAVQRKARHSVEQVVHFLEQGRFKWPVPD
jgi:D-lactate dehydrogenase